MPAHFPLTEIFHKAVIYGTVIWDRQSKVVSDRDPFDCVPDFSEIGVARSHVAESLRIPQFTIQQWKEAVAGAEMAPLARQALGRVNEALEWEDLARDRNGLRQPGSLGTAFGLLRQGLRPSMAMSRS